MVFHAFPVSSSCCLSITSVFNWVGSYPRFPGKFIFASNYFSKFFKILPTWRNQGRNTGKNKWLWIVPTLPWALAVSSLTRRWRAACSPGRSARKPMFLYSPVMSSRGKRGEKESESRRDNCYNSLTRSYKAVITSLTRKSIGSFSGLHKHSP